MNNLRPVVNQNREELENKIGDLTHEVRSVESGIEECNSSVQIDKRNYQLEIQRLNSQIDNFRTEVNGNLAIQRGSAVCTAPRSSSTISLIDVGRPTS